MPNIIITTGIKISTSTTSTLAAVLKSQKGVYTELLLRQKITSACHLIECNFSLGLLKANSASSSFATMWPCDQWPTTVHPQHCVYFAVFECSMPMNKYWHLPVASFSWSLPSTLTAAAAAAAASSELLWCLAWCTAPSPPLEPAPTSSTHQIPTYSLKQFYRY